MPALTFNAIMNAIMVSPAAVGVRPATFCRYCGMKMFSATIELHPKACATVAQRTV